MTTPERSVEEILEKFKALPVDVHKNDIEVDWLTQTLKAERQKREEMVEAERERIYKRVDYLLSNHGVSAPRMDVTIFNRAEFMSFLTFDPTQPNNQK